MMMRMHFFFTFLLSLYVSLCNAQTNTSFQIGVILDSDSRVGRIGLTSLSLALDDFYSLNTNYNTRLVLHFRDSKGQVTDAAASALNLLKDVEVDAIIGPQKSSEANFVIDLGNKTKVPIISYSATSPSLHPRTPFFLQTAISDAAQVDAIAAIVHYFNWYQVVFIYEDSDYGTGIIPYLSNAFQHVNARVLYRSVIPLSATDDFILLELYKMKTMQTRVFVVQLSSSLANRFFLKVKEADMMNEGYVWIVTSGLMDLFYSLDPDVVEAMQGVLGVKPLIPSTQELKSTTLRWNKKFADDNPGISQPEMGLFGVWAYDTLWALAMAAEKVGFKEPSSQMNATALNSTNMFVTEISETGPKLLKAMQGTTFQGLGGNFSLVNEQLEPSSFQILNVVGNVPREVGIWTPAPNSRDENVSFSGKKLKSVIWPGDSKDAPKGWEIPVSGVKLKIGIPAKAGFAEFVNVEKDPQTNVSKISGYYIDLFKEVMDALPFAVRYDFVPFEKVDGLNAGSYNDLSYQVYLGNYDGAVGDITITYNRSQYVDFTLPIEEGGITRTELIEEKDDKWFFLSPLHKNLWLAAIGLFIFTGLTLWVLEHRLNRAFRGPPAEHIGLIFYIPFMSLVFSNRERIVSNLARLVIVVWIFVVLILTSTYTASLSSKLTVQKLQKDYKDVNALVNDGDYVGCREGSFIHEYLVNQLKFRRDKIRTYSDAKDVHYALSNKGDKDRGITAFFSCTPYTNLFLNQHCKKYRKVGSPYPSEGFAFVFPKGSPLVAHVSRQIVRLTDDGTLSGIKDRWIKPPCNEDEANLSKDSFKPVKLRSFRILFAVTGGITASCLVVFLITYLYRNRDFIQRISSSGATAWTKVRAIGKHFDQRDPKSFRSSRPREDCEDGSPDRNVYSARKGTVVPISSEDEKGENSQNSEQVNASTDQSSSVQLQNIRVV